MNEPATGGPLLCIAGGATLYIGGLSGRLDWHFHGAPAFVAGLASRFRLRLAGRDWLTCRAAVIPAGIPHLLELGADPMAVLYLEPDVADRLDLSRLGLGWSPHGPVLVANKAELSPFRELYEAPDALSVAGEALDELIAFARGDAGPPALDLRIARVLAWLQAAPDDRAACAALARAEGVSESRFLHLFGEAVGVPFRRYRIWNRLRAAMRLRAGGSNITEAAFGAGFSDSAHFSRLHRRTFGRMPSAGFRTGMRAVALPGRDATDAGREVVARLRVRFGTTTDAAADR
jgi:AraC-like DNA-binding protein